MYSKMKDKTKKTDANSFISRTNINHNNSNSKMYQEILKMAKITRFSFSSLLSIITLTHLNVIKTKIILRDQTISMKINNITITATDLLQFVELFIFKISD